MKTLKESILSSTKTGRVALLIPKTKEELKQMIANEIEEKGWNCDLNHIKTHKITDMWGYLQILLLMVILANGMSAMLLI